MGTPQRAQAKTVHEMASKLAATHKVRTRLAELFQPLRVQSLMTRKEWLMGGWVHECSLPSGLCKARRELFIGSVARFFKGETISSAHRPKLLPGRWPCQD